MTEKYLRVEMPDGSEWDVPARLIADDYATYYAKADTAMSFDDHRADAMGDDEQLIDWAENNMNWSDVAAHAVRFFGEQFPDYHDGWINGVKEIVER